MPYYVVSSVDIFDADKHAAYSSDGTPAVARHRGRFVVKGGKPQALEGNWQPDRMTIVEFPTAEDAKAFYESPEYQAARLKRLGACDFKLVLVGSGSES